MGEWPKERAEGEDSRLATRGGKGGVYGRGQTLIGEGKEGQDGNIREKAIGKRKTEIEEEKTEETV